MKKLMPTYGLVCAGGGAHGSYQVGVLKYIHEHFSNGSKSPFQIFTGSSCGALNTTFFAAQSFDAKASRLWLEELWLGFHVPGYHGNLVKNALLSSYRNWLKVKNNPMDGWSILDPTPMTDVIRKGFKRPNLNRSFNEGSTLGVGIAGTEVLTGRCCWFVEGKTATPWNLFHSVGILDTIHENHVAASCSVPVFLPPVKIGNHYFLDGSANLQRPLSAAISMGATRILNISTNKPIPTELPTYQQNFKPRMTNVIKMLLNRLSHDAADDEAIQLDMINRFYQALPKKSRRHSERLHRLPLFHEEALPQHYRPIEVYLFHPSKKIDQRSVDISNGSKSRLPKKTSRFMFHEKFIRELIDLGYRDAAAKHGELQNFFTPPISLYRWRFFRRQRTQAIAKSA